MGHVEDKINELKEREAKALAMGGPKAVAKQAEQGKLTARQRLNRLFDSETFPSSDDFMTFCREHVNRRELSFLEAAIQLLLFR